MRVSLIALGALMVTMAACESVAPTVAESPKHVIGPSVYMLATVDGKPLPYRVAETSSLAVDLIEQSLTLLPNNTYRIQGVTYSLPAATTDTFFRSGTYIAFPTNIMLIESGGSTGSMYELVNGSTELDGDAPPTSTPVFPTLRAVYLLR